MSSSIKTPPIRLQSVRAHMFAVTLALWNFSVLLESSEPTSLVSYNIKYEKLFGLQDPYTELTGGAFGCGRDCHGTDCLELSHDEFRFRQHLFIPGQRFIGDSAAGGARNTGS